jgi:hypothetical protein
MLKRKFLPMNEAFCVCIPNRKLLFKGKRLNYLSQGHTGRNTYREREVTGTARR